VARQINYQDTEGVEQREEGELQRHGRR